MDRFLKRPADTVLHHPLPKKPSTASKQGRVTDAVRVTEYGSSEFNAEKGKLFCRPCNMILDHIMLGSMKAEKENNRCHLLFLIAYNI